MRKRRKIWKILLIVAIILALVVGLFSCIGGKDKVKKSDKEKDFVAENLLPDLPEYDEEDETKEDAEEVVVSNSKSNNRKKSDSNYMKKPETNAEKYGAANDKAIEEAKKNAQDKEAAEEAQKEAAKKPIEVVIPEDTDDKSDEGSSNTGNTGGTTGDTNKDEEGKVIPVDTNVSQTKEPERVIVTDDGTLNVIKESDYQENKKKEEASEGATETDELGREVIEIVIPFGDEVDAFAPAVVSETTEVVEESVPVTVNAAVEVEETVESVESVEDATPITTCEETVDVVEESVEVEDDREVIEMVIEW